MLVIGIATTGNVDDNRGRHSYIIKSEQWKSYIWTMKTLLNKSASENKKTLMNRLSFAGGD